MAVNGCSDGAKEVAVTIASVKLLGRAANFTISVEPKLSITKRKSAPAMTVMSVALNSVDTEMERIGRITRTLWKDVSCSELHGYGKDDMDTLDNIRKKITRKSSSKQHQGWMVSRSKLNLENQFDYKS